MGPSDFHIPAPKPWSSQFPELRVTASQLLCREAAGVTRGLEREKQFQDMDLWVLACLR